MEATTLLKYRIQSLFKKKKILFSETIGWKTYHRWRKCVSLRTQIGTVKNVLEMSNIPVEENFLPKRW